MTHSHVYVIEVRIKSFLATAFLMSLLHFQLNSLASDKGKKNTKTAAETAATTITEAVNRPTLISTFLYQDHIFPALCRTNARKSRTRLLYTNTIHTIYIYSSMLKFRKSNRGQCAQFADLPTGRETPDIDVTHKRTKCAYEAITPENESRVACFSPSARLVRLYISTNIINERCCKTNEYTFVGV